MEQVPSIVQHAMSMLTRVGMDLELTQPYPRKIVLISSVTYTADEWAINEDEEPLEEDLEISVKLTFEGRGKKRRLLWRFSHLSVSINGEEMKKMRMSLADLVRLLINRSAVRSVYESHMNGSTQPRQPASADIHKHTVIRV